MKSIGLLGRHFVLRYYTNILSVTNVCLFIYDLQNDVPLDIGTFSLQISIYSQQPLFVAGGGGVSYVKKYLLKFAKARLTTLQNIGGETRKSTFVRTFLLLCEVLKS